MGSASGKPLRCKQGAFCRASVTWLIILILAAIVSGEPAAPAVVDIVAPEHEQVETPQQHSAAEGVAEARDTDSSLDKLQSRRRNLEEVPDELVDQYSMDANAGDFDIPGGQADATGEAGRMEEFEFPDIPGSAGDDDEMEADPSGGETQPGGNTIGMQSSKSKKSVAVDIPLQSVPYSQPSVEGLDFVELFQDEHENDVFTRWMKSTEGKFTGEWKITERTKSAIRGDKGLRLMEAAKHHAIFTRMGKLFELPGSQQPLALSYEVKLEDGLSCGGAYLKLFDSRELSNREATSSPRAAQFSNETPYVVMFGPDRCGPTNKIHFIIRRLNPSSNEWIEHHLKNPPMLATPDSVTHQYGFTLNTDQTYSISVDNIAVKKGSLETDFDPPFIPPETIDDPEDTMPKDWDLRVTIPDPGALKPADWDDRNEIPDPDAEMPVDWLEEEPLEIVDEGESQPADWNEAEDGLWVQKKIPNPKCEGVSGCGKWNRPMKANPNYKGKWNRPSIPNPDYKGPFVPRKIQNPAYFKHSGALQFAPVDSVGFELWTMSSGILFDNVVVAHDPSLVAEFVQKTWQVRNRIELEGAQKQAAATEKETATTNIPWNLMDSAWWMQQWARSVVASQIVLHEYPMAATVGVITIGIMVLVSILRVFKRPTSTTHVSPTEATISKRLDTGPGDSTESSSRKTSEESTAPREAQMDSDEASESGIAESPEQTAGAVRRRRPAAKRD